MTKFVAVHQLNFMPWIGFWHKAASADLMVLYAGVQFDKSDYTNRVRLEPSWLTVPVSKHSLDTPIKDIRIADVKAVHRIAQTLRQRCMSKRNPYGERLGALLMVLETWPAEKKFLVDLNISCLLVLRDLLGVATEFAYDGRVREAGQPVANLEAAIGDYLRKERPKVYLSGAAAFSYMDFDSIKNVVETRKQVLYGSPNPDTVVQLIANQEKPLDVLLGCGGWQTKEGLVYASDQTTLAGAGAAL